MSTRFDSLDAEKQKISHHASRASAMEYAAREAPPLSAPDST
jgi:hypothetical protein